MIRKCLRCNKGIDSPDDKNADYVIAADFITDELRDILYVLKHNAATELKEANKEYIDNSEYDWEEVPNVAASTMIEKRVLVLAKQEMRSIQKTGIVCPDCYKPTDTLIWGVHKR